MTELTLLGGKSEIPASPADAILEFFDNKRTGMTYAVRFTCPEFTSLCPKTGQPDFAHIVIDYVPNRALVESKSLKLFLTSFRNHGSFHEDCTMEIAHRLYSGMRPTWLRIAAYWYPRGGIPIDVFWQSSELDPAIGIPPLEVPMYRGRG